MRIGIANGARPKKIDRVLDGLSVSASVSFIASLHPNPADLRSFDVLICQYETGRYVCERGFDPRKVIAIVPKGARERIIRRPLGVMARSAIVEFPDEADPRGENLLDLVQQHR